jgi:DNA-directed RNA polymerase specialized sigma24 family protein
MSHHDSNTLFEQIFEDRLAQVEPGLIRRVKYRMGWASDLDHDDAVQEVRVLLWKRFSAEPEKWAALPLDNWRAYAHACLKYAMFNAVGGRKRYRETHGSDLVEMCRTEDEVTIDDAISMSKFRSETKSKKAHDHDMERVELRIDLERAIERGLDRLYNDAQRRDLQLLIYDIQAGYNLTESIERHDWTRNRGVTMMRKLRTVVFEEFTGKKKIGYLGNHHPLTDDEIDRIKELYATGLSYRKVAAIVGRSASAVEGICKRYPPEVVAKVRKLRKQGLSYQAIAQQIGRSKSYVGWLLQANGLEQPVTELANDQRAGDDLVRYAIEELGGELVESVDWPRHRDGGDDLAAVPVTV